MYAKLNQAAKAYNVHFRTILSWARTGKIKYITTPSGVKHYELPSRTTPNNKIIGYVRVSSHSQKQYLQSQTELLLSQYPSAEIISEIGSGLILRSAQDATRL